MMRILAILCLFFVGCSTDLNVKAIKKGKPGTTVNISGYIAQCDQAPIANVLVVAEGTFPKQQGKRTVTKPYRREVYTDANGFYIVSVPMHWSGTVTPAKTDTIFEGHIEGQDITICPQ